MSPLHLQFDHVAPGQDFHAALITWRGTRSDGSSPHTHDFWEMMYVLEGVGTHWVNEQPSVLKVGELLLLRPDDCHAFQMEPGDRLHFINIAFPAGPWHEFSYVAKLQSTVAAWTSASSPQAVNVPETRHEEVAGTFQHTLRAFIERPSQLELCRFWSMVLPLLMSDVQPESATGHKEPSWLSSACQAMHDEKNLQMGLPRLVELSGVSQAHLSRTLKACRGQTPTEFINELKLKHAATQLTTTGQEIIDVAYDCGFNNLSYFYRLFSARFGQPPHAFRLSAHRSVAP